MLDTSFNRHMRIANENIITKLLHITYLLSTSRVCLEILLEPLEWWRCRRGQLWCVLVSLHDDDRFGAQDTNRFSTHSCSNLDVLRLKTTIIIGRFQWLSAKSCPPTVRSIVCFNYCRVMSKRLSWCCRMRWAIIDNIYMGQRFDLYTNEYIYNWKHISVIKLLRNTPEQSSSTLYRKYEAIIPNNIFNTISFDPLVWFGYAPSAKVHIICRSRCFDLFARVQNWCVGLYWICICRCICAILWKAKTDKKPHNIVAVILTRHGMPEARDIPIWIYFTIAHFFARAVRLIRRLKNRLVMFVVCLLLFCWSQG